MKDEGKTEEGFLSSFIPSICHGVESNVAQPATTTAISA
jgi:hypothetical protein